MFPALTSSPQPSGLSLRSVRIPDTDTMPSQGAFLPSSDVAHSREECGKDRAVW